MFEYAWLAIEKLDFDGLRFDFVKGYGAWMIGLLAKYRYQKKDGREFTPFVVGEYWSGPKDIDRWLDQVRLVTDDQIAVFDFPLRYKLKDVCDTPNYDLRKLTDSESVSAGRPFNAVTFTENHDMGGDEVVNDKMIGYSFILTGDGYPCIFWWDYFNCELARPRTRNGIDALIDAHHRYAGGKSSILHADPDLYIMQRHGTESQRRLVYAEQSWKSMERHFGEDQVDKY
jgi:alpha-amylase